MGARGFAKSGVDVVIPSCRLWSLQQEAIFRWFEGYEDYENLLVRARAGTGKTSVIVEGVNRSPETSVLVCAFNKHIADTLNQRVKTGATALTLHAAGFGYVRREWRGIPVDRKGVRADALTATACEKAVPRPVRRLISFLHTKCREMIPLSLTRQAVRDVALFFDCIPDGYGSAYTLNYVVDAAMVALDEARQNHPNYEDGIDFADMIFLPLVFDLVRKDYELVVVDEGQDMSTAQLTLAQRMCEGRICIVGDDRQCQPAGTMVSISASDAVPIEKLEAGNVVVTYDRQSGVYIHKGRVNAVASRDYKGDLITVATAFASTQCTPNHKWLARWTNRTAKVWVTYLMRQGGRFRVGQCRLFREMPKSVDSLNFGVGSRARVERADEAWILKVHSNIAEALAYEQILSCTYGIPEICFHEPSGIRHFKQEVINKVFSRLGDLRPKAIKCLEDHGRDIRYPIYTGNGLKYGRRTLFEIQACNLLSGFMAVPVLPGKIEHNRQSEWHEISVSREYFEGVVYSLDIDKHNKYVADGLTTCNSIYQWNGIDSQTLDKLKVELSAGELPLQTTYRCGQSIVRKAQALVPDIQAASSNPEGIIDTLSYWDLMQQAKAGDFILSRINAPLVAITLHLLKAGKRARMKGRDIGATIQTLLKRLGAEYVALSALAQKLDKWERETVTKFAAFSRLDLVDRTRDEATMLRYLMKGAESTQDLLARIDWLFSDEVEEGTITCSSVHKAKGLEADRVFVLQESFYRRGRTQEEDNIAYVACTRAKNHLSYVVGVPNL